MSIHALTPIPGHTMESITSTDTQNHFGRVLGRVQRGVVVGITRHDEVSAVLLSAETYQSLVCERTDPLAKLRDRFDQRVAGMQTPEAKAGARALFAATPEDLGRASVKGAKHRG